MKIRIRTFRIGCRIRNLVKSLGVYAKNKNATLEFFVTHCDLLAEAAAFAVGAK